MVQAQTKTTKTEATDGEITKLRYEYFANKKSAKVYVDKTENSSIKKNGIKKSDKWEYPSRKGVILVTADWYRNLIPSGHAAIVLNDKKVVESLSDGVQKGNNDWNISKRDCSAVTPYDTTATQDKKAANYAVEQIGKTYNWEFLNVNTTKKFYCSQLVWKAFKKKCNVDLNTSFAWQIVYPLELANTDETYFVYVK